MTVDGEPADGDTAEMGMAGTDDNDAAAIGAGIEPDDQAEGQAMLDEARESGKLQPGV
jgi:hypothetical protein